MRVSRSYTNAEFDEFSHVKVKQRSEVKVRGQDRVIVPSLISEYASVKNRKLVVVVTMVTRHGKDYMSVCLVPQ